MTGAGTPSDWTDPARRVRHSLKVEVAAPTPRPGEAAQNRLGEHRERRPPALDAGAPLLVAYFSLEFGLTEALPIYSGGLGVLAGDHLKAANDLDLPLVGVGLLYRQGFGRQRIDD